MARTNRKVSVAAKTANEMNDKLVDDTKIAVNKVLDNSKGKFAGVLVIGMTDAGKIDVDSNITQYPWLHYAMQRATFELLLHEKNQMMEAGNVAVQSEAEAS